MGEVCLAVADPVSLREGAVQQHVVRVGFAHGAQQAGCILGEQVDEGCRVGVGRADGDAKSSGELADGVAPAQVRQADRSALVRWELASTVIFAVTDFGVIGSGSSSDLVTACALAGTPEACGTQMGAG